jgi:hypothetical protein
MTFRDEREAQRARIAQLEDALVTAERERDEARAKLEREDAERERDGPGEPGRDHSQGAQAPTERESAPGSAFPAGTKVHVEWRGRWWPATVQEVVDEDRWLIHYDDWSSSWDETVGRSRIVSRTARLPGPLAGDPGPWFGVVVIIGHVFFTAFLIYLVHLSHGCGLV